MNTVTLSGVVEDCELRRTDDGKEVLNFILKVEGRKGSDPRVRCGYFPNSPHDIRALPAGARVVVVGYLRHRYENGGLYIGVNQLMRVTEL